MTRVQLVRGSIEAFWEYLAQGSSRGWRWNWRNEPELSDEVWTVIERTGLVMLVDSGYRVTRNELVKVKGRDGPLLNPPVFLRDVLKSAGLYPPARPPRQTTFDGKEAELLKAALKKEQKAHPSGRTRVEGSRHRATTLSRDPALRQLAITVAGGVCPGCGFDYVSELGSDGWKIFEGHHLDPLAARVRRNRGRPVPTGSNDLVALCPTCHRLVEVRRLTTLAALQRCWR